MDHIESDTSDRIRAITHQGVFEGSGGSPMDFSKNGI